MSARWYLLLSCAAVLLSACGPAPDRAAEGDARTLTIKTDDTPPPEPKAGGGKLAVLPDGVEPVTAEEPRPVAVAAAPDGGQPSLQSADLPQRAEPYRPARPGAWADDDSDQGLIDECLAADREGDAFARSRMCRRVLGH